MDDLPAHIRGLIVSQIQEREADGHRFLDVRRDTDHVEVAFTPAFEIDPDAGRWIPPTYEPVH
jgi:hypothetical protein